MILTFLKRFVKLLRQILKELPFLNGAIHWVLSEIRNGCCKLILPLLETFE
jgi:hypothetical protein